MLCSCNNERLRCTVTPAQAAGVELALQRVGASNDAAAQTMQLADHINRGQLTVASTPGLQVGQSITATQTQEFMASSRAQARTTGTATEHHELQTAMEPAVTNVVEEIVSTSASSASLGYSLTEQANMLMQQMQDGLQHARMSGLPARQHPGMQPQFTAASHMPSQV